MTPDDLNALRREFKGLPFDRADLAGEPLEQLRRWLGEAVRTNTGPWFEPNAMSLATVDADSTPDARIVLLKELDDRGLVFYTHATSRKGRQLHACPHAAAVFYWGDLERQVRLRGRVELLSADQADVYWASRPRGSRLGSAASDQSTVIASRKQLEDRLAELETQYADGEVPRPAGWMGYRIVPEEVEFWQGRPNRLHDRLRYRQAEGRWVIERLSP